MALDGVEIFTNSSGSHHEFQKLSTRIDLIRNATAKCGGVYLYANQQGCDGERVYYDGCACISMNGAILAQGTQFSLKDVEVVMSTVDLEDIRSFRSSTPSRGMQAAVAPAYPRIQADITLSETWMDAVHRVSRPISVKFHTPEEEIQCVCCSNSFRLRVD